MDDTNKKPATADTNASGVKALLEHVESLLPYSQETSVSSVQLYFDPAGTQRLLITGLRFPSGSLGQIRFDYRTPKDSLIVDMDVITGVLNSYGSKDSESSNSTPHILDPTQTSEWLIKLIKLGTVQKL